MLKVDLGLLKRLKSLEIDESVPASDPMWDEAGLTLEEPLRVQLVLEEQFDDVVANGTVQARATVPCRRCLEPVAVELDQPVHLVFRAGITEVEAESEEEHVYALPEKARELDLTHAMREQVVLGAPQYVLCKEDCRGLCPHCGADWNRGTCDCTQEPADDRWSALKRARLE
jgi:uncharacterized protein